MNKLRFYLKNVALTSLLLLSACQSSTTYPTVGVPIPTYSSSDVLMPTQPRVLVYEQAGYWVDYSNAHEGYLSFYAPSSERLQKAQVSFNDQTYTYTLVPNQVVVVPLQEGSGTYQLRLLQQLQDTQYAVVGSLSIDAVLRDETRAFLYPNQLVDYTPESLAVQRSFELTTTAPSEIERVYAIYTFLTETIAYDYPKAEVAKTTFILPKVDETLSLEKGICFDYAALMSAMLRVQHIPTRIITGFTDLGYHAWVEVYIQDEGWINPSIYFKQSTWTHIDPTFDASGSYKGGYTPDGRY